MGREADSRVDRDLEASRRSGEDRRVPTDRRRGSNRLLELHARRDGSLADRRGDDRRDEAGSSWLSFLIPWRRSVQ